jgi:peptidoglycan-associated lipoprotein
MLSFAHTARTTLAALAVLATLAACSSVKLDEQPSAPIVDAGKTGAGATTDPRAVAPVTTGATRAVDPFTDPSNPLSKKSVFFDFDSFVVKDDYRPMLEAHAKVLAANRGKRMTLEGHTDDRGGREYNLALGQKRAEAVLKTMVLLGVQDNQLEAVSFGEEKPAVQGSDEAAWAKNRRVELKDK